MISLAQRCPRLVAEWNEELNGCTADQIKYSPFHKVWWKCCQGHSWQMTMKARVIFNKNCKECNKLYKRISIAERCSELISEWDEEANGCTAEEAIYYPHARSYWKCRFGHKWETAMCKRVIKGSGCHRCKKIPKEENSLKALHPDLAKEWSPKNQKKPEEINPGGQEKYWRICEKGHEYLMKPTKRTNRGDGCPYCSGQKVCYDNSLEYLYPNLAKQWHPNNPIKSSEVRPRSKKKVLWICPKNSEHIWESSINNRVLGRGCPYCANKKVDKNNNLSLYPELVKEWSDKNNISPELVLKGSHTKYWWKCKQGHEWQVSPMKRTGRGDGCPDCVYKGESYTKYVLIELNYNPVKKTIPLQVIIDNKIVKRKVIVDFSIMHDKIFIEYNGGQHYHPVSFSSKKNKSKEKMLENFRIQQARDQAVRDYCQQNNIHLIEIDSRKYGNKETIKQYLITEIDKIKNGLT